MHKLTKKSQIISFSISFFLSLIFCISTQAITQEKIYLRESEHVTSLRAQKVSTLPQCTDKACFKRPTDAIIAGSGSFFLVVDSSLSQEEGIFLNKYNVSKEQVTSTETIKLLQSSSEAPLLSLDLNKNDTKAIVYREPTEGEEALVQVVNITDGTVKELKSVSSTGLQIGKPSFIDKEGKNIIAPTINSTSNQLIIVDTETDVENPKSKLPDSVQSLKVAPDLKNALITYEGLLAQSVSIYNIQTDNLTTLNLDPNLTFTVDDFLPNISFDFSGKRAALSSFGGNHVVHFVDLQNNKLTSQILDSTATGATLSSISQDGMTIVSAGRVLDIISGFKVYKTRISSDNSLIKTSSALFEDGSIVLDVNITPDQSKILILTLKQGTKKLKILEFNTLQEITELDISQDNAQSFIAQEENGRFAITTNTNVEPSVTFINDFSPGPIIKSIVPSIAPVNSRSPFTINGFIDISRFTTQVDVCFQSIKNCAEGVSVTDGGKVVKGLTPVFLKNTLADVIIIAHSRFDSSTETSIYSQIFQFSRDTSTIADTLPPEITVQAPLDGTVLNSKRILVLGKIDGTGSEVASVIVNGEAALLSSKGEISTNFANFVKDLTFESDGTFEIKVQATDKAGNSAFKTFSIKIDTLMPDVTATIEQLQQNQFKVSGSANGTGSSITSISINGQPLQISKSNLVNFTSTVSTLPVTITAQDSAGNKKSIELSVQGDNNPPLITIHSPLNGQIFKDTPNVTVSFTATDESGIDSISFNGQDIPLSSNNNYNQGLTLVVGKNSISITAIDKNNNKSTTLITVSLIQTDITVTPGPKPTEAGKDILNEKQVVTLPSEIDNLNESIINSYNNLASESGRKVDLPSTVSVEISNPPPIPEGAEAKVDVPELEGFKEISEDIQEIPIGFAFASPVLFIESEVVQLKEGDIDKQNVAVLTDSTGRTFIVGLGFLKKSDKDISNSRKNFRFQTSDGNPIELTTTLTIPADAASGDAKVSILNKNESLATIPFRIVPERDVRTRNRKRQIGKPQIQDPIVARVKNSGSTLVLRLQGKNFIKKIAVIDGRLQRLIDKTKFFTNVTFVPQEGITIKRFQLKKKNKIILIADIDKNIEPGIKLFNVVTPVGADIGGVVIPAQLEDGLLQTSTSPEDLILSTE